MSISSSRIRKIIKEEKCLIRVAIVTSQLALVFLLSCKVDPIAFKLKQDNKIAPAQ